MPLVRKRPAQAEASPSPPPTRRRRSESASAAASDSEADGDGGVTQGEGHSSHNELVKKLVRLALASGVSRQPLRRSDITAKVFSAGQSRSFKPVFNDAQKALQETFGMTLKELPLKEKVTISQKRAAQKNASQSASNSAKAYILTSALPLPYRRPAIIEPSRLPSSAVEAGYTGLYSFVVGLLYLSGTNHRTSEKVLEKYLQKCNGAEYVVGESTEKVLKKMEKEGYIVKIRDRDQGGDETIDYMVGPRGRVEIGEAGVAGLVRGVWGKRDVELEELENRMDRSLGQGTFKRKTKRGGTTEETHRDGEDGQENRRHENEAEEAGPSTRPPGRPRHNGRIAHEEASNGRSTQSRSTRSSRRRQEVAEEEEDGEDGGGDEAEDE